MEAFLTCVCLSDLALYVPWDRTGININKAFIDYIAKDYSSDGEKQRVVFTYQDRMGTAFSLYNDIMKYLPKDKKNLGVIYFYNKDTQEDSFINIEIDFIEIRILCEGYLEFIIEGVRK